MSSLRRRSVGALGQHGWVNNANIGNLIADGGRSIRRGTHRSLLRLALGVGNYVALPLSSHSDSSFC